MKNMFDGCNHLEYLDLSCFNTKNVENMHCMLGDCCFLENLDLSYFNTQNVKDMGNMFNGCSSLIKFNYQILILIKLYK